MPPLFADRPKWLSSRKFIDNCELTVTSEPYGVTWRHLRHNIAEILHPSRTKAYSNARKQDLGALLTHLESSMGVATVQVMDHFQFTIFCLLARMSFDDKLNEDQANKITAVHLPVLLSFKKYEILHLWSALTRILLRSWWTEYLKMRKDQVDVILPLIRAREQQSLAKRDHVTTYVDTLLQLELEVDGKTRNLAEQEMVSLCSEFMNAGTDTKATSLQWIMANIVKYPRIQDNLFREMKRVLGGDVQEVQEVQEEDLPKLPYLKATVLDVGVQA